MWGGAPGGFQTVRVIPYASATLAHPVPAVKPFVGLLYHLPGL
jgi:hypothetical protein